MNKKDNPYISKTNRTLSDEGLQKCSAKLVPPFSVILSTRAPIGHLIINKEQMATNQGCRSLVPCNSLHYKYLYFFLWHSVDFLNSLGTGATFKELSAGKLRKVKIPFPPLLEQQRIVSILDEVFEGIGKAVTNVERNLENNRELFESFLNDVFSNAYTSGTIVNLLDIARDVTDGDHSPPPKTEAGIPFITIKNIDKRTRKIDFSDTFKVPHGYYEKLKPNKKPQIGDVLYTVTGSYGIPVLVEDETDFCFQRHIGLIRPKSNIDSKWLSYLLLSPQIQKQADNRATGTAQKTVSLKVLRSFGSPSFSVVDIIIVL
jgi:type I restriction enzyme S subunit